MNGTWHRAWTATRTFDFFTGSRRMGLCPKPHKGFALDLLGFAQTHKGLCPLTLAGFAPPHAASQRRFGSALTSRRLTLQCNVSCTRLFTHHGLYGRFAAITSQLSSC